MKNESEYQPTTHEPAVGDLGPNSRKLSTTERLRLGYLTGQEEDPREKIKDGFFKGVDPDFPQNPNA